MKITIHQPDFMSWIGFFNKISRADCWVVLDHVENNPRNAAFYGRRVKVLINGEGKWLSVPLMKSTDSGIIGVPIMDMRINLSDARVMKKNLKTIDIAYARAPFFSKYRYLAESYFKDCDSSLMKRNMRFIKEVMRLLNIEIKIVYSSDFDVQTKSTEMLIDLLILLGANTYLCGDGAQGYQKDELYKQNGIVLEYNQFQHPSYPQFKKDEFVPGLSILDALFFAGEEVVASWMGKK